jgi:hypothetical protein
MFMSVSEEDHFGTRGPAVEAMCLLQLFALLGRISGPGGIVLLISFSARILCDWIQ